MFRKDHLILYLASAAVGASAEVAFQLEVNLPALREPRWLVIAAVAAGALGVYYAVNLLVALTFATLPFLRSLEARAITAAAAAAALPHLLYLVTNFAPLWPAAPGALYVFAVVITPLSVAGLVRVLRHPPVGRAAAVFTACLFIAALAWPVVLRLSPAEKPGKPNVVLITADALRPDHLAVYGYERSDQPNISFLGNGGTVVKSAACEIPLSGPSHANILTSVDAGSHGVLFNNRPLPEVVTTLAERFRAEGYATAAFIGGSPLWRRDSGFDRGFNAYDDATAPRELYKPSPLIGRGLAASAGLLRPDDNPLERTADEVTDRAVKWLRRSARQPFFLWVNYFDAHDDYLPPASFSPAGLKDREMQKLVNKNWALDDKPPARLKADISALYDGELSFIDHELGRLLETLRDTGALTNTIVCFTASHGETLGERGNKYHGFNVYREDIRIPLIFYDGGADLPPVYAPEGRIISAVDIGPSLLDLAGIEPPEGAAGTSLFSEGPVRKLGFSAAIPDPERVDFLPYKGAFAVYDSRLKLVVYVTETSEEIEFYNLENDPGETVDTYTDNETTRALGEAVRAYARALLGDEADLEN